jgi:hypothetical protein
MSVFEIHFKRRNVAVIWSHVFRRLLVCLLRFDAAKIIMSDKFEFTKYFDVLNKLFRNMQVYKILSV